MHRPQKPARHRRATAPGQTLPALDRQALKRLASDMHSTEAAEQFAATYIRMLPARVERITQALDNGDEHQAMDAVLSLKTSSAMIGALRMEEHCARLEHALARTDRTGAAAAGKDIKRHQTELAKAFRAAEAP